MKQSKCLQSWVAGQPRSASERLHQASAPDSHGEMSERHLTAECRCSSFTTAPWHNVQYRTVQNRMAVQLKELEKGHTDSKSLLVPLPRPDSSIPFQPFSSLVSSVALWLPRMSSFYILHEYLAHDQSPSAMKRFRPSQHQAFQSFYSKLQRANPRVKPAFDRYFLNVPCQYN